MANPNPVFFLCHICLKFMSYADVSEGYAWTPYNFNTLDWPDTEYAHRKCYEGTSDEERSIIAGASYIKPSRFPVADTETP